MEGAEFIEVEHLFSSVESMQRHFDELYGVRNAERLPTAHDCVDLFAVGIRDLRQARRASDEDMVRLGLARLGSRLFPFAMVAGESLSVAAGLEIKYPMVGCGYCRNVPCTCAEVRGDAMLALDEVGDRASWSLSDWQKWLHGVYNLKNQERGVDYTIGRLSDELVELIALEHFASKMKPDELRLQRMLEVADLTAWTLAIGNLLEINVQTVVEERYGNGCPTCGAFPCSCSSDDFDHVYEILS